MASTMAPVIQNFKADAAIAKGKAVKCGTDSEHVAVGAAVTDDCIGIAQSAAAAAEDKIEVALPGGGAKALAQTSIVAGTLLVSHTDGALKPIATAGDRIVAVAKEAAVAGDLFEVLVVLGQAYTTE